MQDVFVCIDYNFFITKNTVLFHKNGVLLDNKINCMPGKIPQSFINELLSQTDIVELIHSRIKLKKYGKNYQTNCPFHSDKTPSFTVNQEKQFYYCFGCNAHGNAIDFLINYEKLSFLESIEELSMLHNMQIPLQSIVKNKSNHIKKQILYLLIHQISKFYQKNILFSNIARSYLLSRGINQKMIDFFSIGYSSKNWNDFSKKLNINKEYEKQLLINKILKINQYGIKYDVFQERVTFPIHDKHGRVIGFGGRSVNNILPKYINSSESEIFYKKNQIYGLYQVIQKNSYPEYLLVVEGYIDVIMLTQYNVDYVVSSLGTSITKEQVQLLFRKTDTVIYCYDGDNAGKNAAWRTLKISLPYISDKKTLKFILLPSNEDPDTLIQKEGKIKFEERIRNAITMTKFFFQNILQNVNLSSNDDKFYLSVHALPLINSISSDTIRIYLRQILGRMIGILDDDQFKKFLYERENTNNKKLNFHIKRTPMRTLIGLLIQNPSLARTVPAVNKFKNLTLKGLPIFLEILKTCMDYPNLNTGQLLEFYRNNKNINILRILSRWDLMIVEKEIKHMFLDLLINMYDKILEKRQDYLISQERITGLTKYEKQEIWVINQTLSKR